MAINATFQADFRSFQDAVAKATVSLADLSKGAGRVESSLNRMADTFSGRKVIQEAVLMEKAIESIGLIRAGSFAPGSGGGRGPNRDDDPFRFILQTPVFAGGDGEEDA